MPEFGYGRQWDTPQIDLKELLDDPEALRKALEAERLRQQGIDVEEPTPPDRVNPGLNGPDGEPVDASAFAGNGKEPDGAHEAKDVPPGDDDPDAAEVEENGRKDEILETVEEEPGEGEENPEEEIEETPAEAAAPLPPPPPQTVPVDPGAQQPVAPPPEAAVPKVEKIAEIDEPAAPPPPVQGPAFPPPGSTPTASRPNVSDLPTERPLPSPADTRTPEPVSTPSGVVDELVNQLTEQRQLPPDARETLRASVEESLGQTATAEGIRAEEAAAAAAATPDVPVETGSEFDGIIEQGRFPTSDAPQTPEVQEALTRPPDTLPGPTELREEITHRLNVEVTPDNIRVEGITTTAAGRFERNDSGVVAELDNVTSDGRPAISEEVPVVMDNFISNAVSAGATELQGTVERSDVLSAIGDTVGTDNVEVTVAGANGEPVTLGYADAVAHLEGTPIAVAGETTTEGAAATPAEEGERGGRTVRVRVNLARPEVRERVTGGQGQLATGTGNTAAAQGGGAAE